MKWVQVVNTLTAGQPSHVSKYAPRVTIVEPGSIKVGAKSPQNRRLQQSRLESSRGRKSRLPTVKTLIEAGLLQPGFKLLPHTHRMANLAMTEYRDAVERYRNRSAHPVSSDVQASHEAEYEWIHKNADPRPRKK
jgi:hypothetical protein